MKAATRLLALIATGGVVIGGGAALWQLPEPKTASMASEQAQRHCEHEQQRLTSRAATRSGGRPAARRCRSRAAPDCLHSMRRPPDRLQPATTSAAVAAQAQQLAQAKAALAAISQQLAADEALIARLEGGVPRAVPAPGATTGSTAAHSSRTTTTGVPSIGDDPTTFAPAPIPTTGSNSPHHLTHTTTIPHLDGIADLEPDERTQ